MTQRQEVHDLDDGLPDDSPLLLEVRESFRLSHAIGEAMEDVRKDRTYSSEEFTAKVQKRWHD